MNPDFTNNFTENERKKNLTRKVKISSKIVLKIQVISYDILFLREHFHIRCFYPVYGLEKRANCHMSYNGFTILESQGYTCTFEAFIFLRNS